MYTISLDPQGGIVIVCDDHTFPLYRRLHLTVRSGIETDDTLLMALEDDVYAEVVSYLETTFGIASGLQDTNNPLIHKMKLEILNSFLDKIQNGIINRLKPRGVVSFSIERLTPEL
jgi:hypothetical protein